jgi:hypothetical protein
MHDKELFNAYPTFAEYGNKDYLSEHSSKYYSHLELTFELILASNKAASANLRNF